MFMDNRKFLQSHVNPYCLKQITSAVFIYSMYLSDESVYHYKFSTYIINSNDVFSQYYSFILLYSIINHPFLSHHNQSLYISSSHHQLYNTLTLIYDDISLIYSPSIH